MSRTHFLWVDGGSRGNPGPAAAGFLLAGPDGGVVTSGGRCIGHATNNVAEYEALVWGLETAVALGISDLAIMADSELVVKQMRGEYRVKDAKMKPLRARAAALTEALGSWRIEHVRRERNREADALVNLALDTGEACGEAPWPVNDAGTLF